MKHEVADYGDWRLNAFHWLGLAIVAILLYWNLKRPWSHIVGVGVIWFPVVALQFQLGRPWVGVVLVVIALFILWDVWDDY